MSFVRTVCGDITPEQLGIVYSHEHIVIDESYATSIYPELLLNDTDRITEELKAVYSAGGRTMVDTMPANCGRNVEKLVQVSRASGFHIIAPTGLHLEMYYPAGHWRYQYNSDRMADLFITDIEDGIDRYDYNGPLVARTPYKAGLIKLATADGAITPHQETIFRAVSKAHLVTGAPILTHTNSGRQALAQAGMFDKLGVDLSHVVISHMDKCADAAYIREVLQTGVRIEFDSAFRWKTPGSNPTFTLLETLLPDFPTQITAGMDAAKRTYWQSYNGKPGLVYLLTTFRKELEYRGLDKYWDLLMIRNPAGLYTFSGKVMDRG